MDVREKLVELIGEVQSFGLDYSNISAVCKTNNDILADHLIAHGVTVQEWISVNDRLPEMWQNVLTVRTDGKFRFDFIGSLSVWYEDVNFVGYPVTHWMPLPQPPKGE